jgi:gamma-glutamyl:cysteine ligase YbdK (ATP-grasp superfamily)
MNGDAPLSLFQGYGIEIEYMIVDAETLSVRPICDEVLRAEGGAYESELALGEIAWSNELALHVIELKTNGPANTLANLHQPFQEHVARVNGVLADFGARLLPTGMHPWMNAEREFRVWPHEYNAVYQTFDRIFGCAGHGWANLQSTHINLPFATDAEFGRLHAAIRLVLPIIPGIAASTPFADGKLTGLLDSRLDHYARNAIRVPIVAGAVIPEPIFTIDEYRLGLLGRIYADLAPLDPGGVLRHEWVNARGSIARFDRMALEIRLLDTQECPAADMAAVAIVVAAVRALVEEAWCGSKQQRQWDHRELAQLLRVTVDQGDGAVIENHKFLQCFGFPERGRARCLELWQHIAETALARAELADAIQAALDVMLRQGCLARRIVAAVGEDDSGEALRDVYARLAECLATGSPFEIDS